MTDSRLFAVALIFSFSLASPGQMAAEAQEAKESPKPKASLALHLRTEAPNGEAKKPWIKKAVTGLSEMIRGTSVQPVDHEIAEEEASPMLTENAMFGQDGQAVEEDFATLFGEAPQVDLFAEGDDSFQRFGQNAANSEIIEQDPTLLETGPGVFEDVVQDSGELAYTFSGDEYAEPIGTPEADPFDDDSFAIENDATREHLARLQRPITEVRITVSEDADSVPEDLARLIRGVSPPLMIASTGAPVPGPDRYTIDFCHRPLYFEQPNLERCGGSFGYLQTPVSGAQFLVNTVFLTYHMGAQRPDCPIPNGDCRTCEIYPVRCNPFPISHKGVLLQGAALAGFTFLLL